MAGHDRDTVGFDATGPTPGLLDAISSEPPRQAIAMLSARQKQTLEAQYGVPVPPLSVLDGGAPDGNPIDIPFERSHIMARRGQSYGQRSDDPGADLPLSARPTRGVGLLFWPSTPTSTRSSSSPRRRG